MATFDYMGEEFAYAEQFPEFEYAEFCSALVDGEDSDNARATGVALNFALGCVAPKDRARFSRISRKNQAKSEDWLRVARAWTVDETERPTGLPSDSSDGQSDTVENSESEPVASVSSLTDRPVRGDLALAAARSRTA